MRKQGGEKVKETHLRAAVVEIYDGFVSLCLHVCIFRTFFVVGETAESEKLHEGNAVCCECSTTLAKQMEGFSNLLDLFHASI